MADKEAKKAAELQLAGNDTEEGRQVVMAQRALKTKKKNLEKVEKALKKIKETDENYSTIAAEAAELRRVVAELESQLTSGVEGLKKPSPSAAPAAAQEAAAPSTSDKKTKGPALEETPKEIAKAAEELRSIMESAMTASAAKGTQTNWVSGHAMSNVHPQVVEATLLMEEMALVGCNARTLAMISAFKKLFQYTSAIHGGDAANDLEGVSRAIEANYSFMSRMREATSGMNYVKDTLLRRCSDMFRNSSEQEGEFANNRRTVLSILDNIESELQMSTVSIVEERSGAYISSTDTILVFGRSSVVERILLHAAKTLSFRVIVIDSAPLFEGRELTQRLSAVGISVTYAVLTACCTLLPRATRVFIGASSVLQNGDVYSRCGTAIVAACAKSFRRPVLCFSESYKFVSEVWLGNIGQNHAPHRYSDTVVDRMVTSPGLGARISRTLPHQAAETSSTFPFQGYLYDLTPASYVDMIICEMGCLHTSAIVAAIKDREMRDSFL